MKANNKKLLILSLGALLSAAPLLPAIADTTLAKGSIERQHERHANALLERAVSHLQKYGAEQSLATFNNLNGGFMEGQYYLFTLSMDGTMLSSNGPSRSLVGLNVQDLEDAAGKPFMREILDKAKSANNGSVSYQWLNPADNELESKTSQFHRVGEHVLVVGYYIPRATAEHARTMLDRAAALMKKAGNEAAFKTFNDPQGGFVINDEYVFVIGLEDGKYRASGASPSLVGVDVREVQDAAGAALFKQMIALAKDKGTGTVDYVWRNPATNAVEHKHTLIQRFDDVLLGVGYYSPN